MADAVRATVKDFGPAPQIPPLRLLGGVNGTHDNLTGRVEIDCVLRSLRPPP